MTRPLFFLSILLVAATAAAQTSDVAIAVSAPATVPIGADIPLTVTLANVGPAPTLAFIRVANFENRLPRQNGDKRCTFSPYGYTTCNVPIAAGETIELAVRVSAPDAPRRVKVIAEALL